MIKLKYFLFLVSTFSMAQLPLDSISYDYFYKKEMYELTTLKAKKNYKNNLQLAAYYQAVGQKYRELNIEDSAYVNFYKAYDLLKQNASQKENFLELLYTLHTIETSKNNYEKDSRRFLKQLNELSKNSSAADKWEANYLHELAKDYFVDSLKYNISLSYYQKIQQNSFFKTDKAVQASIYLSQGNLYSTLKEYQRADALLLKGLAMSKALKDNYLMAKFYINLGVNHKLQADYLTAIDYFKKAENSNFQVFKPKLYRFIYSNLTECYTNLNLPKEAKKSQAIVDKLNELIDDFKRNSNFYEIDAKYQLKEKESQLLTLSEKFQKNKILYLTLLFLVFLLALYSFVRWKKEDRKKKLLDVEKIKLKEENIQVKAALEKAKQLVTKDHIVLKNKSKVYLNELIYIKSEDHYLQLITNKKTEFVRGKLSEIMEQLPPNFVKCHRSYIINKNQIKQVLSSSLLMNNGNEVPVSRGFKL